MCKEQYAAALDRAVMPGMQGGPFMNVIAAKAACFFLAQQPEFIAYQKQVVSNAKTLANTMRQLDYRIVAGGTDNHLFIVDLSEKNISGHDAQVALERAHITVSKSCIPFDTASPWKTSGIRLGTPAVTTRGMKEHEMAIIAELIDVVVAHPTCSVTAREARDVVAKLCERPA